MPNETVSRGEFDMLRKAFDKHESNDRDRAKVLHSKIDSNSREITAAKIELKGDIVEVQKDVEKFSVKIERLIKSRDKWNWIVWSIVIVVVGGLLLKQLGGLG